VEGVRKTHKPWRKGLRLLAKGSYLILYADEFAYQKPFSPLLGHAMTVPPGAVWFAQHSGKPIIPHMDDTYQVSHPRIEAFVIPLRRNE